MINALENIIEWWEVGKVHIRKFLSAIYISFFVSFEKDIRVVGKRD